VPALRGRAFCRHHVASRARIIQDTLEVKLTRYRRELDSMDLPRLLNALLDKLDLLRAIIPAYPEAQLILAVASNRLAIVLSNYFQDDPADSPDADPLAILGREELERFADSQSQAATWMQVRGRA
jgi:hypothetical protein